MYKKACKRIFVSAGIAVWNKSYNFAELKDSYMNQQIQEHLRHIPFRSRHSASINKVEMIRSMSRCDDYIHTDIYCLKDNYIRI